MNDVKAIATWLDHDGSDYTWPMATVDNRRSRVLARIVRFNIPCDPTTLTIRKV